LLASHDLKRNDPEASDHDITEGSGIAGSVPRKMSKDKRHNIATFLLISLNHQLHSISVLLHFRMADIND